MTDTHTSTRTDRLSDSEAASWRQAVENVDAVAAQTDSASASKQPLESLSQFVRNHPDAVVRELQTTTGQQRARGPAKP